MAPDEPDIPAAPVPQTDAVVPEVPEPIGGFDGRRLGVRICGRGVAGRQGAGTRVRAGAV